MTGNQEAPAPTASTARAWEAARALAIQIDGVSKRFGEGGNAVHALQDVSLTVEPGEFVSIIGLSGCGKSTLLRLVADIYEPTAGTVLVHGESPVEARRNRELGVVFQDPALLAWRDVSGNIRLPFDIARRRGAECRQRVQSIVELVGLTGFEKHRPDQLSGGMRQRVAMGRALVLDPKVLLFDEPFGALDEITRQRMNIELLRIWSQSSATGLLITHSIPEAVFLSDRVVVMTPRPGRIHAELHVPFGRPRAAELMRSPEFFAEVSRVSAALEDASLAAPGSGR